MIIPIRADWKNRLYRGLITLLSGAELIIEKLWHTAFPYFPLTQSRNRFYQKVIGQAAQQRLRWWTSLPYLPGLDDATKRRLLPRVRHYGNVFAAFDVWQEVAVEVAKMGSLVVIFLGLIYFSDRLASAGTSIRPFFPPETPLIDVSQSTGYRLLLWQLYPILCQLVHGLIYLSVIFLGMVPCFFPLYVVGKRTHHFAGPLFAIGWPTGIIAVYLLLISMLAPIAKIDPLDPDLAHIALAGVVVGLTLSVLISAWFIAWLYLFEGIATLLPSVLVRRRQRLYPEIAVTLQLLRILTVVTTYPTAWGTLRMKHELVARLESLASCLENDLPCQLQSDTATDAWLQRMTRQIAAAQRALKPWVLMPKPDTREHFIARIADAFVHATTGEWDALARSEDEPPTQQERWRLKAIAVAKTLVIAALPLFILWGVQQSPLKIPEAAAGYITIACFIWLVKKLLTSLDASLHAEVGVMQDVAQSVPFFGKWLGMEKRSL